MGRIFTAVLVCLTCQIAHAQTPPVSVMVTEVTDNRTTGKFFAGAKLELSLVGDALADVRGIRSVRVTKAVDDTGRNILKPKKTQTTAPFSFERNKHRGAAIHKTLKFLNPSRKASTIKAIDGMIELYAPDKDPESVVTINNLMRHTGKPLAAPALAKHKISITVFTKTQFEKMKQARKAAREKQKNDKGAAKYLGNALADAFKQMFSGFMRMDENDLAFAINDPTNSLVDIEVRDENGTPAKHSGRTSSGSTYIVSYKKKPAPGSQLVLYLATPASIIRTPLALRNVVLP
jgi:hypothetical protein